MINLRKAEKIMKKHLVKDMKLDFTFEKDGADHLKAKNSVTLKGHDDDILIVIDVYANGILGVDFIFDKLEKTVKTLELIENFNESTPWLCAYISSKGYLCLRYNVADIVEDTLAPNLIFILNKLVSDDVKAPLQLLTVLTH